MRQDNTLEALFTTIIYILIGFAFLSLFAGLFPIVLALVIIAAIISGVTMLYRYIRSGSFTRGKLGSKYDEHGSRKIKSSVIEMKEMEDTVKKEGNGEGK